MTSLNSYFYHDSCTRHQPPIHVLMLTASSTSPPQKPGRSLYVLEMKSGSPVSMKLVPKPAPLTSLASPYPSHGTSFGSSYLPVNIKTTAPILKGIRDGLLWSHSE